MNEKLGKPVDDFRTIADAAKRLGVTSHTIRSYAEQGHFPNAHRLPSGTWRIPSTDIDAFLEQCRSKGRFPKRPSAGTPRHTTQATPANVVTT